MHEDSVGLVFKSLKTPIVHDIPLGGSDGVFYQNLESGEVHDKVKFVLAEVFSSYSLKDHFVFWFTADTCNLQNFQGHLQKVWRRQNKTYKGGHKTGH